MKRCVWLCWAALLCASFLGRDAATAQTLELRWKHDFSKNVSWYVRTSPGILIVKSGKSLTALDGRDGRRLWELADVQTSAVAFADVPAASERGLNLMEVPRMGVLLLNAVRMPSDAARRLVALNLMTGARLWDAPPVDEMMTAIPLYDSGELLVVSRRMQKKALATQAATSALGGEFGFMVFAALPHPYRFELERLDLATGKVEWSMEYPHTVAPGTALVRVLGANIFLYYGNRALGCLDANRGKLLWEDGTKHLGARSFPLPLQMSDGRLIYKSKDVEAVDPETGKAAWKIEKLGKVTGIVVHDGLAVAIGETRIAAVDTASGVERWRKKTHGHTTNLLWEKSTDSLLYMDWKGLHRLERVTGKSLLDAPLQTDTAPDYLRLVGPECVVAIGYQETDCFHTKTGKKLFTQAKLSAFFRGEAFLDDWPLPEEGQEAVRMVPAPSEEAEWEKIRKRTLLTSEWLENMQESLAEPDGFRDAFQTESEDGKDRTTWWVDPETNRQMLIRPAAGQHDVSRPFELVYAVHEKMLWAAKIKMN